MRAALALATICTALIATLVYAQSKDTAQPTDAASAKERAAVERAVLDYCEAFYEMKPELLERSVHPGLKKFGFFRPAAGQPYRVAPSQYEQLIELAKVWNKDGHFGPDAPKLVEVYEVLDKIATAKLTGAWGIDYLHLVKFDDRWQIVHVVWQSPPQP